AAARHAEADGYARADLDRAPADLALALREVAVAEREQRARDVDREEEPRAATELADVDVAAGLARRERPEPVGGVRGDGRRREVVEAEAERVLARARRVD